MKILTIKITVAMAMAFFSGPRAAAAAPNVTAIPIGPSCTAYPGFGAQDGGLFIAVAEATGRAVDGIALNAAYFVDGTRRYGYVMAPAAVPTQNITMRCSNNTLQALLAMNTSTPDASPTWQDLVFSGDPTLHGALGFGFPEDRYKNIPVEPFWHFVDGMQIPGVFLGAAGSSTFGFVDNWAGVAGEYYLLRLLGTDRFNGWELDKRDTTGFLKVMYDL
ncbi:hypothetical protein F4777DRAFT_469225 [Nemania sp. FL0916]|nr:hypothetical protein F4777DRAFT_469225 [Nemania sp. FL0916]